MTAYLPFLHKKTVQFFFTFRIYTVKFRLSGLADLHKVARSWLMGSVLLYVKCTTQTDVVVAVVRTAVAALCRWIAVAVVVVTATTIEPVVAGP